MIDLIPAEIQRQTGRKGSFYGSMAVVALFALGLLLWVILSANDNAHDVVESGNGLLVFATVLCSIVIGATAGAYDVDQGTMRYLVLTGRPRWQLVLVRVPALIVTIVLVTLPAIVIVLISSILAGSPSAGSGDYFDLFYGVWMTGFLYGTLSMAIGTFLKSNGVAIAVAVVLNFAGFLIAGLITENVSKDLGNAFFPVVSGVVITHSSSNGPETTLSVGLSAVLVVVWLVVLVGAAVGRVQRAEY